MASIDTKSVISNIMEGQTPREAISGALDEAATITKKVVRHGKVQKIKKLKRKKRRILSAAQKRAIKKAQQMSQKSSARAMRRKSLKKAAAMEGVDDNTYEAFPIICPGCGGMNIEILTPEDGEENDATIFVCPDCGEEFVLVNAEAAEEADEDDEDVEDDADVEEDEADEFPEDAEATEDPELEEGCENEKECPEESDDEPLYFEDEDE